MVEVWAADTSQGPGWWLASDGKWYPPESTLPPPPAPRPAPLAGSTTWRPPIKKQQRPLTWVILGWNILMAVWLVSGLVGVANDDSCDFSRGGLTLEECQGAQAVGVGIGMGLILFVAAAGDAVLGVIWLVTKPAPKRACPVCGVSVLDGLMVCFSCGYDYRTAAVGPIPERPAIWPPPNVGPKPKARQR